MQERSERDVFAREVIEREAAAFDHPMLKRGGCAVTDAEARFCFETRDVPTLVYHRIASDGPPDLRPYRLSPELFERQLAYLQRHGYRSVTVDQVWHANAKGAAEGLPGKLVAFTFDDGYLDFAQTAWPLLRRYGFTATVYLVADHVGGRAEWDRQLGEPAELMGWELVRDLSHQGVAFGAHSCSHVRLTTVDRARLMDEVRRSGRVIADMIGTPVSGFCYPYGDNNDEVRAAVQECGYQYAVGGILPSELPRDRFLLPRIEIFGEDSFDAFVSKLPAPHPSSADRRAEYARLRLLRDRRTYFAL